MKRRIEEYLLSEEERGVSYVLLPVLDRLIEALLKNIPSTSQDVGDKKELLQAVQLFQTVSGIGYVFLVIPSYMNTKSCIDLKERESLRRKGFEHWTISFTTLKCLTNSRKAYKLRFNTLLRP